MSDEVEKIGTELSSSRYKNLLRKISTLFKELNFVHQSHNKVLVYPNNLKVEDLILQNSKIKSELQTMNHSMGDDTASVIKVAKILHDTILAHPEQMSWPPKEHDLLPDKVQMYIPNLLDVFCITLLSGKSSASESTRVTRLKNSIAQDIVYCVSGEKIKTPKSVLFPALVKSLCNNVEVINNYGHGISYKLIEEIETACIDGHQRRERKESYYPRRGFSGWWKLLCWTHGSWQHW